MDALASPSPPLRLWLADQITRRPAVPAATLFLSGIALHSYLPHDLVFWLLTIAASAIAARLWKDHPVLSSLFLALAILITGVAIAQAEKYRFPGHHIAHFAKDEPRLAQLELYIDHAPRVLSDQFSVGRALPPKQVCVARVTKMKTWNGWIDSAGGILVQIDQPYPRLAIDQTIRVVGLLQRPSPAMNPGQFNWADYYREQRVLCSIGIDHAENIQILRREGSSIATELRQQARQLLAAGFDRNASLDHALLRALLLGDHDPELRDVQEQFRRTGTSHHLAISGLHVAVLGAVIHFFCRLLRCSPRASAWISLGFVIVYGIVALPSPPVVRSVLLCAAFTIGMLGRRSVDAIQMLAVSVIAMLMYHPLDLFNAGFQLSAGTVLGLILFTERVTNWIYRENIDVAVLRSFQKLTPRQRAIAWVKKWGAATLGASTVAWVISTPLIAYHFEQLNPWAIPGSILLAPFVFVALVGGFFKVIFTLLWPAAATAWAKLAALPMEGMRDIVDSLAALPGADVPLPAPPAWAVIAFYIAILMPLLPLASVFARRTVRSVCTVAGAVAVVAPFALGFRAIDPVQPKIDEVSVTLLAVGAGQCAVIAPPRGPLVFIDCGSSTLRDPLRKCIAPFVRHLGRWSVNRVILSHTDYDHISATAEIVEAYGVREVITGPYFARHALTNPPAEGLLRFLEDTDRTVLELVPGNRINLGGGASLDVLWPPRSLALSSNDSGLVLRLTYAGRTVLFPADIQVNAQRALLAEPQHLRADVLVAPHHGSNEETTTEFINAVNPQVILSSNDRTLSMKQSDFEYSLGGRQFFRTHRDGSVTVRINKGGLLSVHTYRSNQ